MFLLQVWEELRVCVCELGCYCGCRVLLLCALGSAGAVAAGAAGKVIFLSAGVYAGAIP